MGRENQLFSKYLCKNVNIKEVLIASSLMEEADIYIWDEPLNYLDVFSRIQIEKLILEYKPTLIFVEHDLYFQQKIATRIIDI